MAQGKTKQQSKSRRGSRPPPSISKLVAAGFEHHEWVESLIDPIGAPAAQVPDMWPYATQATKLKMVVDITTNFDGVAVTGFGGGLATGCYTTYAVAAPLSTANFSDTTYKVSAAHTDYTAYSTAFDRSRITCAGYKFVPYLTPETSMGMVGMLELPYESVAGYSGLSFDVMMTDAVSVALKDGLTGFSYPMEEPIFSSAHSWASYFPTMLLIVKGAKASTKIGELEVFFNMEGVSDPSSVHAGGSTIEPYDPVAHANGTHVTQQEVAQRYSNHRRLTAQGRAIADTSAAVLGYTLGGGLGNAVSVAPSVYRESKKRLKKLLHSSRK